MENNEKINNQDSIIESTSTKRESINDIESNTDFHLESHTTKSSTNNTESNSKQRDSKNSVKSCENTDSSLESSTAESCKNNTDSKKLDSNGYEIIWQIQYNTPIINNIISWGLRIGWVALLCYFFSLGLMKYMEQYEQYSKMEWYKQAVIIGLGIVFAILIWNLLIVILQTLNLKTIYATNDNLIIQKYFGKNVALPLGSFYIVFKTLYRAFETEYAIIRTFDGSTSFTFGIAKNHKNFMAHGIKNIEELEKILKPKIEKYLITLEEKYFQDFLSFDYQYIHGGSGSIMLLDMENILRLRKETDCGK